MLMSSQSSTHTLTASLKKMNRFGNTYIMIMLAAALLGAGCAVDKSIYSPPSPQQAAEETADSSCSYFYFLWGSNAEYDERYAEALEAYEKALICDPSADYVAEKIPVLLIQLGRFDEATVWLENYIKTRPEKTVQRYILARLKIKDGKVDEAIQLYQDALDLDPQNNNVRLRLGALYSKKGQYKVAESIFKTILQEDESSYFAVLYLARLYSKTDELGLAEKRYLEALEINWSKELSYEIAEFYNLRKKFQKAQEVYQQILVRHEKDERAALGVVQTYLFLQRGEEALQELTRIREFTKNPQRIDIVRSQILINIGETKRAKDVLINLLKEDSLAQASYLLGIIYYEELNFIEALNVLKHILPTAAEYRESMLLQVRILEEQNRSDQSIQLLQNALSQEATRLPVFYSLLASIYQKIKQPAEAVNVLLQGLDYYPDNQALLYEYAILMEKRGDHEAAMNAMQEILRINPNHADSLNFIGYSWADRNINLKRAYKYIRKAIKLKPESGYIQDSLGWVYYRLGEYDKAKVELERAIELEPDDPYIYEHLGDTYRALGNKEKSLFNYQKALEILTDEEKIESIQKKIIDLQEN